MSTFWDASNLLPSALSWNVVGGDRWSKMDFMLYPEGYVLELPADTAFVVILRACNVDGSPRINWDGGDNFTRQRWHWGFTLMHATHPSSWCPGVNCPLLHHWPGWWEWAPELLIMAVVRYQEVPPFIDSLTQVMGSYHPDGNFEVEAGMTDLDGEVTEAPSLLR